MNKLIGKNIVLALTGSIACYKVAYLCRELVKLGAKVQVVMTEAATKFISPLTMQTLSQNSVFCSQWQAEQDNSMPHIKLSREADLILVAPASADFIAQLASGRADELLSLLCLARPTDVPLLLVPAMNLQMWQHPATQRNIKQVVADGATTLGVGYGEQACGEFGDGRMLEPEQIIEQLQAYFTSKILLGKKVLISAGPTFEAIDTVRGITNLSSGKMGFALAKMAQYAGAQVCLVAGPVSLATPNAVQRIDVVSAEQMCQAVLAKQQWADVFISVAAVADWTPQQKISHKLKKQAEENSLQLNLTKTQDILALMASSTKAQQQKLICIGFAAESENLLANAQEKRRHKGVPLLVANLMQDGFATDTNKVYLIEAQQTTELAIMDKEQLAEQILHKLASYL